MMVSKVGGRQTFQVKTLVGCHKCGRVFGNKNANKDWIAHVLVDKFMNVGVMTMSQIIDEIKKTYNVGITLWRAGKAKRKCSGLFGRGRTTTRDGNGSGRARIVPTGTRSARKNRTRYPLDTRIKNTHKYFSTVGYPWILKKKSFQMRSKLNCEKKLK